MASFFGSYLSGLGLRVPDVSKLWRGAEASETEVDGKTRVPVLAKLEGFLSLFREASLWTRPSTSLSVVAAVHLLFAYLSRSGNTAVNLTCWALVLAILYTTWVNTIWPEIRVVDDDAHAVHDGLELAERTKEAREKILRAVNDLREFRSQRPGLFCLYASAVFAALGLLGTQVTASGLFYYSLMAYLTVPGAFRYMNAHSPPGAAIAKPDAVDSLPIVNYFADNASTLLARVRSGLASAVSRVGTASPESETDDLQDYLPEVDDPRAEHILDGAQRNAPGLDDDSLDYSSLMTGLGSVMPDVDLDEPDSGRVYPALPFSGNQSKNPFSSSKNYENQNEVNSLIHFSEAALSNPYLSAELMPSFDSEEIERDDFEFISEAELDEPI